MSVQPRSQPSAPWRFVSSLTMGLAGSLSRVFLMGLSKTEVIGLDNFLAKLDERNDIPGRSKGLITVSNHVSVLDDPMIWGVLPFKYSFDPGNHRWSLGSYDLCFKNKGLSTFFSLGQVLPTHRLLHSPYGGLFQPTMTQAIRLLSSQPFSSAESGSETAVTSPSMHPSSPDISDPFTSNHLSYTYTTNGEDTFPAPAAYSSRAYSWVHIFPEGRVHQHPQKTMRYFRWGVSRLILESDPLPTIVPMFIDGPQDVMHESRTFPRFVPRIGKTLTIVFGEEVDGEKVFGDLRRKWQRLVSLQKEDMRRTGQSEDIEVGLLTDELKYGPEAVELRKEVTLRVREEVLKVRRSLGLPNEDPKEGLVETWAQEGLKKEGKMDDGSWVKDA